MICLRIVKILVTIRKKMIVVGVGNFKRDFTVELEIFIHVLELLLYSLLVFLYIPFEIFAFDQ